MRGKFSVVPAKARAHSRAPQCRSHESRWIPAFAGMTIEDVEASRVGQGNSLHRPRGGARAFARAPVSFTRKPLDSRLRGNDD